MRCEEAALDVVNGPLAGTCAAGIGNAHPSPSGWQGVHFPLHSGDASSPKNLGQEVLTNGAFRDLKVLLCVRQNPL